MKNPKGFISIGILIAIILGVVIVGSGAYYVMQQSSSSQESTNTPPTSNTPPVTTKQNTQTPTTPSNTAPALACDIKTDGSAIVATGQDVYLYWGSSGAVSYDVKGTNVDIQKGEARNGNKIIKFTSPGTYTYTATAYGANSAIATCKTTITVVQASSQAPTKTTPFSLIGSGTTVTLQAGEAIQGAFLIQLVSTTNGMADIKVSGRDYNGEGTQELILKQGQEGLFLNFYPLGLHIIPTVIANGSATLSIKDQSTD
jgi:hypothetical protein